MDSEGKPRCKAAETIINPFYPLGENIFFLGCMTQITVHDTKWEEYEESENKI